MGVPVVNGRAVRMKSRLPPKYSSSVRMESAAAPAFAYATGVLSGRPSLRIHPFDGDFRLNSAMIPDADAARLFFMDMRRKAVSPLMRRACSVSICLSTSAYSADGGSSFLSRSTSMRLCAMISSRMSFISLTVQFHIFLQNIQCLSAFKRFTCHGEAFFDVLVFLDDFDGKRRIGQYSAFLTFRGSVFQYVVEDA